MSDKQLMQWMLIVDILILVTLAYDVYLFKQHYQQGGN
jgi:hypothetical protein